MGRGRGGQHVCVLSHQRADGSVIGRMPRMFHGLDSAAIDLGKAQPGTDGTPRNVKTKLEARRT